MDELQIGQVVDVKEGTNHPSFIGEIVLLLNHSVLVEDELGKRYYVLYNNVNKQ